MMVLDTMFTITQSSRRVSHRFQIKLRAMLNNGFASFLKTTRTSEADGTDPSKENIVELKVEPRLAGVGNLQSSGRQDSVVELSSATSV